MAPQKKGKGKGKKDGVKEKSKVQEPTEWDELDIESLNEAIYDIKQKLEKHQKERNYSQVERDNVQDYYDITQQEIKDIELKLDSVDQEVERVEEEHRVEIRVYTHKVRHLEYEHKNKLKGISAEKRGIVDEEKENHEYRTSDLKHVKIGLKEDLRERCLVYADEIKSLKKEYEEKLLEMKHKFESDLSDVREKCNVRLLEMEADMELRRKLEIHDVEERKNLHVNESISKHKEAFDRLRTYYKNITKENLKVIKKLKEELVQKEVKACKIKQDIDEVTNENKRLEEPLSAALEKVTMLRDESKNQEKDRLSLHYTKARLMQTEKRFKALTLEHEELKEKYKSAERERDELYQKFEEEVADACEKNKSKNLILEHKLENLARDNEVAEAQLNEVVKAASMDVSEAKQITSYVGELLSEKNARIEQLLFSLANVKKEYNDNVQSFRKKLAEAGLPKEEVVSIGELIDYF